MGKLAKGRKSEHEGEVGRASEGRKSKISQKWGDVRARSVSGRVLEGPRMGSCQRVDHQPVVTDPLV